MMSALPAWLKMSIAPPVLNCTTTVVFDVLPGLVLMFEIAGGDPAAAGYAARNDGAVTLVTVRFSTMAVAPAGIPFAPVTCHVSVSFDPLR
jgi:hypothetical protein